MEYSMGNGTEYSIKELSEIAGVSARTLRYYDQIGLLKPLFRTESGYRYYGENEINILQQILFYRERGFRLDQISNILYKEEFNTLEALQEHLRELQRQKVRLEELILTVNRTIDSLKGEDKMSDQEKFEAFKSRLVQKNEEKYGGEIRKKYGEKVVDETNEKMMQISEKEYSEFNQLEEKIRHELEEAVKSQAAPDSLVGKRISEQHKEWLNMTWTSYTKEMHLGVTAMYVEDERFRKHYDRNVKGCAEFLRQAVEFWMV